MDKKKGLNYSHWRKGDLVKVEIRDATYRLIYKKRFNIQDKNAILSVVKILEEYSGFSIRELIKEKLNIGEWF